MKVGLITTLDTNIGDDFIREGILSALEESVSHKIEYIYVNKHIPCDIYPPAHPIRWTKHLPKGRRTATRLTDNLLHSFKGSRFETCDLIIQCGAPVFFNRCARVEWSKIVWEHVLCRLADHIPILNLAAGSCYPWEKIPATTADLIEQDRLFIEKITKACALTMVRDPLSKSLLDEMNLEVHQEVCSAFLAARRYQKPTAKPQFVFFNYMKGGGHFDFGQQIDADQWEQTMRTVIEQVRKKHPVAFICHNKLEFDLAGEMFSDVPRFLPRTVEEYFNLASLGLTGVFNRMHAAVAFGGLGIPSIAVGADTRMNMVRELGVPVYYVKEVNADILIHDLENLLESRNEEAVRLKKLSDRVFNSYVDKIKKTIK